jgi:uncharacterized membrane protein
VTAGRTEVFFGRRLLWVENEHLAPTTPLPATRAQLAQSAPRAQLTPVAPRTPPRPPVWTRPGFVPKLMALVGAAVTLIGVAFLLVLAAQMGFYGPEARTISAAVLAGVLVWLAFVVRRRDPNNVGAPILAATGIASAYLSVVAATVIYGWFVPIAGVVAAAVVGLAGLLLARHWENQWLALVAVLGSLLLAPFIGFKQMEPTVALMLVVTAVTLYFEHESDWRLFPFARVLPTTVMLLLLSGTTSVAHPNFPLLVGMTVGLAWLGLLSAVIAPAEPGGKGLKAAPGQLISIGLLVPMVLPVTQAGVRISEPWQSAIVLSLVAVPLIVVGLAPAIHERVRWAAVPLGAGLLLLAGLAATDQQYLGVMALGFGAVYLAIAVKSRSKVNLFVGAVLGGAGVLGWLPLTPGFLLQVVAVRQGPEQIVQSLVGIAAVVLGGMAARAWLRELSPAMLYAVWGPEHRDGVARHRLHRSLDRGPGGRSGSWVPGRPHHGDHRLDGALHRVPAPWAGHEAGRHGVAPPRPGDRRAGCRQALPLRSQHARRDSPGRRLPGRRAASAVRRYPLRQGLGTRPRNTGRRRGRGPDHGGGPDLAGDRGRLGRSAGSVQASDLELDLVGFP